MANVKRQTILSVVEDVQQWNSHTLLVGAEAGMRVWKWIGHIYEAEHMDTP